MYGRKGAWLWMKRGGIREEGEEDGDYEGKETGYNEYGRGVV